MEFSEYDLQIQRDLTRKLDQMEARDTSIEATRHSPYPVKTFEDRTLRRRAFYLESCLTALVTPYPDICIRAGCQAYTYSGEDWNASEHALYPGERDYLINVRNRMESFLRPEGLAERPNRQLGGKGAKTESSGPEILVSHVGDK